MRRARAIRRHGRMFELGMVAEYKLRSGALLQDVAGTDQSTFPAFMMIGIPILAEELDRLATAPAPLGE